MSNFCISSYFHHIHPWFHPQLLFAYLYKIIVTTNNPTTCIEFGAISPCEMNEFSDECEAWEAENGPYEKGNFMVKSNARTKGR